MYRVSNSDVSVLQVINTLDIAIAIAVIPRANNTNNILMFVHSIANITKSTPYNIQNNGALSKAVIYRYLLPTFLFLLRVSSHLLVFLIQVTKATMSQPYYLLSNIYF